MTPDAPRVPGHGPRLSRPSTLAGALAAGGSVCSADAFPAALRAAGTTRAAANPVVLALVPNLNFPQWPITQQDFQLLHSLDGKAWQQAGPPSLVEMVGAWVGLFATAHQNGLYVHATFDSLQGFAPDHFVQIGTP